MMHQQVYAAELAPARIRGALVMGWQLWVTFGELSRTPLRYLALELIRQASFWVLRPTALS